MLIRLGDMNQFQEIKIDVVRVWLIILDGRDPFLKVTNQFQRIIIFIGGLSEE